mmetsp:Transcript_13353/g.55913  ORF Transcript_13353/g.55913 Transcript_13353/m.55913 type:complete len:256 (+) Transcript_13353:1077-1844(+)
MPRARRRWSAAPGAARRARHGASLCASHAQQQPRCVFPQAGPRGPRARVRGVRPARSFHRWECRFGRGEPRPPQPMCRSSPARPRAPTARCQVQRPHHAVVERAFQRRYHLPRVRPPSPGRHLALPTPARERAPCRAAPQSAVCARATCAPPRTRVAEAARPRPRQPLQLPARVPPSPRPLVRVALAKSSHLRYRRHRRALSRQVLRAGPPTHRPMQPGGPSQAQLSQNHCRTHSHHSRLTRSPLSRSCGPGRRA